MKLNDAEMEAIDSLVENGELKSGGSKDGRLDIRDLKSPTKASKPTMNLSIDKMATKVEPSPNYYEVEEEE